MLKRREYPRIGETVWRDELPDGLRLTVVRKPGYRKTQALLAVDYGGADRRFRLGGELIESPSGTAHLMEHRLFQLEDGSDAMTVMSRRGAGANAFTSPDMTAFYFECVDSFQENLELLLRFVHSPVFEPEGVEREKEIVASEIRMTQDDPDDALYYSLMENLYAASPLRENVAGTVESVREITPEQLYLCHRGFYVPSNMSLVVVGDQDPRRVRDTAERLFPAESLPAARRERPEEGPAPVRVDSEREMDVGAPMFLAGVKTAGGLTGTESVKFELTASLALNVLLGTSSPLYQRLYSQGLINETFGGDFENAAGYSHLTFGGETKNARTVCLRVLEEAAALAASGIDPAFLDRQKRTVLGSCIRAMNSFDSICYNTAAGDFSGYDYFDTLSVLDGITGDDIRGFLGEYLTQDRMAVSVINRKER